MSDQIQEEVAAKVFGLFGKRPVKSHQTPCLICGRQCVRALRVHPSCEARDPDAAEAARIKFFTNYKGRA